MHESSQKGGCCDLPVFFHPDKDTAVVSKQSRNSRAGTPKKEAQSRGPLWLEFTGNLSLPGLRPRHGRSHRSCTAAKGATLHAAVSAWLWYKIQTAPGCPKDPSTIPAQPLGCVGSDNSGFRLLTETGWLLPPFRPAARRRAFAVGKCRVPTGSRAQCMLITPPSAMSPSAPALSMPDAADEPAPPAGDRNSLTAVRHIGQSRESSGIAGLHVALDAGNTASLREIRHWGQSM